MADITGLTVFETLTTAVAAEVNGNFTAVTNQVNGNLDNSNIVGGAGITADKLDLTSPGAIGSVAPSSGAFTTLAASTSLNVASTIAIVGTLDDDTMGTATDTTLATSESIKAYTDSVAGPMSALTTDDSTSDPMLSSISAGAQHSYTAQTDGWVTWTGELDANAVMTAFVDTDTDPVSGGVVVGLCDAELNGPQSLQISFSVASGESFEFITDDTDAPANEVITWRSSGSLSAPVDNN